MNKESKRWQQFNSIMDNEKLNSKEKLLLLAIFRSYNAEKGYSYPSKEVLKKRAGIAQDRDYYKYINSLELQGYICKKTIVGKGCIFYYAADIVPTDKMTVTSIMSDTSKKTVQKENNIYISLKFIDDSIDKVKLTKEQYNKLKDKFSEDVLNKNILNLDNYISNGKGRRYKDHYKVLNIWCRKISENTIIKQLPKYESTKF